MGFILRCSLASFEEIFSSFPAVRFVGAVVLQLLTQCVSPPWYPVGQPGPSVLGILLYNNHVLSAGESCLLVVSD